MLKKKIKILCFLLLLIFTFGCTNNNNNNSINENSYKGLGIFYYFEIDSGSYYDMIFIPFHFKINLEDPKEISKQKILQNAKSIIFERGLGFGTFRNGDIFDKVFLNSESCETKKYCFAYVDFVQNDQKEIKKWNYDKKELSIRICIDKDMKIVKYYHTKNAARNLIKINTLKIIK
ncbi:hypothetical protein CEY12_18225 [Chryseobacterium sp. T16E-39]|uniref:hypothetical protein n=1 Tax=Chryseobacterium sp. T16E-39 TaxID=2015076 RepID=UPI000B5B2C26|nr:hypothetical protein [Chryseobacterium sp. T16E-39]ASK31925.1 hypothetical protein CEY12_18225 [Chryseobacterium sp. T16E-39]